MCGKVVCAVGLEGMWETDSASTALHSLEQLCGVLDASAHLTLHADVLDTEGVERRQEARAHGLGDQPTYELQLSRLAQVCSVSYCAGLCGESSEVDWRSLHAGVTVTVMTDARRAEYSAVG